VSTKPGEGQWILERFGEFDELIVGRSWFNSGVKRFATDMGAIETLPQVIGILETVQVSPRDWSSLRLVELGRFIGRDALYDWERRGYPISAESGRIVYPETH